MLDCIVLPTRERSANRYMPCCRAANRTAHILEWCTFVCLSGWHMDWLLLLPLLVLLLLSMFSWVRRVVWLAIFVYRASSELYHIVSVRNIQQQLHADILARARNHETKERNTDVANRKWNERMRFVVLLVDEEEEKKNHTMATMNHFHARNLLWKKNGHIDDYRE